MAAGDALLVEQVDRLTRLNEADWLNLRALIDSRGIRFVALDVPASWLALKNNAVVSPFVNVITRMLFDLPAVMGREDHEDRRRRSAEGILGPSRQARRGMRGGERSPRRMRMSTRRS